MEIGYYGQGWAEGVLVEHVTTEAWAQAKCLEDGSYTVDVDGDEVRVLCGDIIWMWTEDGRSYGRCGLPVMGAGYACSAHMPVEGWNTIKRGD